MVIDMETGERLDSQPHAIALGVLHELEQDRRIAKLEEQITQLLESKVTIEKYGVVSVDREGKVLIENFMFYAPGMTMNDCTRAAIGWAISILKKEKGNDNSESSEDRV